MKSNTVSVLRRKPGRPTIDRRDEILDAAHRLYDRIGFEKTTIGDIAGDLAMSPANIYRSFPNRRAIDEAIAARRLSQIEDAAWSGARSSPEAPVALRTMVTKVHTVSRELMFDGERLNELCAIAAREHWGVVDNYLNSLRGAIRHVIMEGQRSGQFAKTDPEAAASTALHALMAVWHPRMIEAAGAADLTPIADDLCALIVDALSNKMTR